jgi:hypothetical protein
MRKIVICERQAEIIYKMAQANLKHITPEILKQVPTAFDDLTAIIDKTKPEPLTREDITKSFS